MLAGGRLETACDGGVWARVLSLMPLLRPENGSDDSESKSAWGTVFPKSSLLKTREYIRFASSATVNVSVCSDPSGVNEISTIKLTLLEVKF